MRATAVNTNWAYPPVPGDDRKRCGNATFAARRCTRERIAVGVRGEIDAVNARDLGRYVVHHTRASRQLVLDLRAVDFFGTQGFTALYYISVHCTRADVDWTIVASRPVRRLLTICEPDGELPVADNLRSALNRLDRIADSRHHTSWAARTGWAVPSAPTRAAHRRHGRAS